MSMEMNAWNLEIVPDDLVCSPRGNTLTVSHKASNLDLQIRFRSLAPETMERLLDRLGATGDSRQDVLDSVEAWPVALATLECPESE